MSVPSAPSAQRLDADLGDHLAAGRYGAPPGDLLAFEAAFTALVEAAHPDRDRAWDLFYDATVERVEHAWADPGGDGGVLGCGTVATFSRIWQHATGLVRGTSVLDVGTCFGFLPLAWARRPGAPALLAADLVPGTAALVARQARRLAPGLGVVCADGTRLPVRSRSVGTVLLLHVLEHVPPPDSRRLLDEALRVAQHRVVVAVPVEDRPDPVFGHVQVFDLAALAALGRRTGWTVSLADTDGAWLVLDRPRGGT